MKRLKDLQSLDGRVAIVTGGSGHLGLAFAQSLSELGAIVAIVDLKQDACDARAKDIEAHSGIKACGIAADLADPTSAETIVKKTQEAFGRIDILVNNAAFTGVSGLAGYAVPFNDQSLDAWESAMRVNLTAAFLLVKAAREALDASGHGAIINIGSIYGIGGPDLSLYADTTLEMPAAYAASKGGLMNLTKYLSTVLAPKIRVNAISPGGIERGQAETFQERYVAKTPMRRMATEEDFKGALAFLASDASQYVTGQNLIVDGGWSAW